MVVRHPATRDHRWRRNVLPLGVVTVLLGACGGDGDRVPGDPTPRSGASEVAATPPLAETAPSAEPADEGASTIEPPLQFAGSSWVVTHYRQSDGAITNPLEDDASLFFGGDGTLSGHNGCNDFAGTWETTGPYVDHDAGAEAFEDKVDGQPIAITVELTSSVECEGFLADQDADLTASLAGADLWLIGNILGDREGGITLHGDDAFVHADPA